MKRFALLILLLSAQARAQIVSASINTPNTFSQQQDFLGPVNFMGPVAIPSSIVSALPAASVKAGRLYRVSDGVTTADCTVGGGAASVLCMSNGVSWAAVGGSAGGTVPASAQIGDILRFNTAGDGTWDAVNYMQRFAAVYVDAGAALLFYGSSGGSNVIGSAANINPTLTTGWARTYSASASASTNTVIGIQQGNGGNSSLYGMESFYRLTIKLAIGNTTNVRYWVGLGCWNNLGAGNNGLQQLGTVAYATDVPNKSTIAFRYSAGTDTHWMAVTAVAAGSQTTIDTGVTPDTNTHLFSFAPNATGTAMNFLIDGAVVATSSTNLPPPANAQDSWGSIFWSGDNKNTATAIAGTFHWAQISLK